MLYNENLHEEEQHLIQQIAEQTERGKICWELTECIRRRPAAAGAEQNGRCAV